MKKILFTLLFVPLLVFGQLDEDYEYDKEFIWGVNKNTNGGMIGSIVFKWSRSKGNDVYGTFGFELSNVKHPKESRFQSNTGQTFIIGKTNYLYAIRLQYGRDKLLFRKDTQQGVQINAGFMGGPTIGIHAPYYILNNEGDYEQYDPNVHFANGAVGPGRLFQGLGESDLKLGLNVKGGVSFEFGTYKNNVAGIEAGVMVEAFSKKIILMPTQDNRAVFPSAYILLYWGKRK